MPAPPAVAQAAAPAPPPARVISIHAPPRGATPDGCLHDPTVYFNSRPSARGDFGGSSGQQAFRLFQFTPLREGRRANYELRHIAAEISIHAPPRGATNVLILASERLLISIHAPPRGATPTRTATSERPEYFNSRPSARGDVKAFLDGDEVRLFQFTPLREGRRTQCPLLPFNSISIHAPPRGAT